MMRVRAASAGAFVALAAMSGCKGPSPRISQDAPSASGSASTSESARVDAEPSASASATKVATKVASVGVRVVIAPGDADALSVIRTERLKAKADGRVLIVYAGAGWCEPCRRFKRAVDAGTLDEKLPKTTLLVFDADSDGERLASAGYKFQFIPYAARPGADGHPSDSVQARKKGSEAWRELVTKLEEWQRLGT